MLGLNNGFILGNISDNNNNSLVITQPGYNLFLAISDQVFGINPSTVRVTWRYVAPTVKEEPLTGYKVRIWSKKR